VSVRAVAQRVTRCTVRAGGRTVGEIGRGLLVYVGVARDDTASDVSALVDKVCNLRVFPDATGTMNRSVAEEGLAVLAVSQFTLLGDARRGRRPSYSEAAPPEAARALYDRFLELTAARGVRVAAGAFQEHMEVDYLNDGPVTILIDTRKVF
jgi:D-aminoacyl-tRNA deacylase